MKKLNQSFHISQLIIRSFQQELDENGKRGIKLFTRISNKKIWQRGSNKSNNYTRKKVGNNWKDKFISSVIIIILLFSNM